MNTIIVPYNIAMDMYNARDIYHKKDLVRYFVLDEFTLVFKTKGGFNKPCAKVKLIEGTYDFMYTPIGDNYQELSERWRLKYDEELGGFGFMNSSGSLLHKSFLESDSDGMIRGTAWIVVMVCNYIMNYQRGRKEVHSVPKKYSREHRLSTSHNKIYLLDDIIKYVHDNYVPQGGHHEIKCPSWEVRGHYRHYKSGKTVFIRAYKKGKQRDKVAPKEKEYYV